MNEYLEKVLIYLKQELPDNYKDGIEIADSSFVVSVPNGTSFSTGYEELFKCINASIGRVRVREFDFEFIVKSENQQREFKILK